ncbi:hypothetical protein GBAR_LOCUS31821 [Geodia barretti]|uniref:Uncharacterized protein n=1 Tax=Geodia barretti TaxID=519541 RepID=A0AA35U2W6_GEOBA|nr:hypothetical protein GBAR_LOCUS31821 [Geodia barretti]
MAVRISATTAVFCPTTAAHCVSTDSTALSNVTICSSTGFRESTITFSCLANDSGTRSYWWSR